MSKLTLVKEEQQPELTIVPRGPITPERAQQLEVAMLQYPQAPCPVVHRFGPGVYMREVTIPKGVFAIGHHQNVEHMNIMLKGSLTMLNEDGSTMELKAPFMYTAKPGRKISYSHEEVVWMNIYPTTETDVEKLETTYLTKTLSWQEAVANLEGCKMIESRLKLVSEPTPTLPYGSYKIKVAGQKLTATSDIEPGEVIGPAMLARYAGKSTKPNAELSGDNLVAIEKIKGCLGGLDGEQVTICQA